VAEAGTETRKVSGEAEEITEAVRGAGVHLAGSVTRSGGGVRGASRYFLKIGAFTRGIIPLVKALFV
jgi:hypothetical protein